MGVLRPLTLPQAEYVLLSLAYPGRPEVHVGVLLLDEDSGSLECRLREDWSRLVDAEDAAILRHIGEDLVLKAREMGGEALLASFEDSLSNILRIGPRERISTRNPIETADRLFRSHVLGERAKVEVLRHRTHAPLLSIRAAATKFGEDLEAEPEGWVEIPPGVRPSEDLFVAQVVGRSMEPRIPDGSFCLFKAGVTGSRQGKLLLIRHAASARSGGEYTIKRYRSEKVMNEEGWEHTRIRLEPLNPEFEAWDLDEDDEFQVIGEFVRVLDEPEVVDEA